MFFKVSLKKICLHLYLALSEYHTSLLTANVENVITRIAISQIWNMNFLKKMSLSLMPSMYFRLWKGQALGRQSEIICSISFFLSTTEYLILDKKIHRLEKNIRCGNTTELWKSNKSMKILCAFVILCKEMKFPGYTLRS